MADRVYIQTNKEMMALVARVDKENPKREDLELLRREFDAKPELYRNIGNISGKICSLVLEDINKTRFF